MTSRVKRFFNLLKLDGQFRKLGWWPGSYMWNFYQGRLRDHLPNKPSKVKAFRCKHGITGKYATLYLRIEPSCSDFVTLEGVWSNQDYYHPAFEGCKTILDVGGNIGFSAVWFSEWLKPEKYACVEPDPRNLPVLKQNVEANNLNAVILPCAATATPGEFEFNYAEEFGCSYLEGVSHQDTGHVKKETIKVPGRTMLSILEELNWPRVDLLKIDIEGGEKELLRTCSEWIDRIGQMALEIHSNTSPEEIQSFLPSPWKVEKLGKHSEPTYRVFRS